MTETKLVMADSRSRFAPHRRPDAAVRECAAQLCSTAWADMTLIDRWSRESRLPSRPRTG